MPRPKPLNHKLKLESHGKNFLNAEATNAVSFWLDLGVSPSYGYIEVFKVYTPCQVMPRVATGFISFLSLQVFRPIRGYFRAGLGVAEWRGGEALRQGEAEVIRS